MSLSELVKDESVLRLLSREAAMWAHPKQLRDEGRVKEAREFERRVIKRNLGHLRDAQEMGGWMEVYVDTYLFYPKPDIRIRSGDTKGMKDPMVEACRLANITIIDFTHLGEEIHNSILRLPEANPWRPDKGKNWSTMSYCPLHYFIEQVEKLGAIVINKDAAITMEIFGAPRACDAR
jgi:hypothetical protein